MTPAAMIEVNPATSRITAVRILADTESEEHAVEAVLAASGLAMPLAGESAKED